MQPDLRNRLLATARGDFSVETGVTPVTGVTAPGVTGLNHCSYRSYVSYLLKKGD